MGTIGSLMIRFFSVDGFEIHIMRYFGCFSKFM